MSPATRKIVAVGGVVVFCAWSSLLFAKPAKNRPYAYLLPAELRVLTEHLQQTGVQVCELREDIELEVETHRITSLTGGATRKQPFRIKTEPRLETRWFKAGTILVKAKQDMDGQIARLLDPRTNKGPRIRRLLPEIVEGKEYPIVMLNSYAPTTHGPIRPLAEKRASNRPITFETVYGPGRKVDFGGSPVSDLTWLEDGEHYLQARDGRLYKVRAASGRSVLFVDPNKLLEGLQRLPALRKKDAESLSKRTSFQMSPDHNALLLEYENDLYYARINGTMAVRLTSTPGEEKYATFDPQGRFIAFVRDSNLYVVDVATQTERALTLDGDGTIRNGEADWVYFEEVFDRQWKVFWWSPDSSALAFFRTDNAPVPRFTVVNNVPRQQRVETTAYPRAGEPNPTVRLGVVSVAGGPVKWVDLDEYAENDRLITGAGWLPDSEKVYFFVQDRAQTWLDINTASRDGGAPERLLRETTKAWIEPPETLKFLADSSFLLSSERTGWKHLYLYDKDARLKHPVTRGEWEARKVHYVDEQEGWVYLSGTRDAHVAENLYRAKLDGSTIERLTKAAGRHDVSISPTGKHYIDRWSNASTPTQVVLCANDGTKIRTLDTNPVYYYNATSASSDTWLVFPG